MDGQFTPFTPFEASFPHTVRLAAVSDRTTSIRSKDRHPPNSTVRTTLNAVPPVTVAGTSTLETPNSTDWSGFGSNGLQRVADRISPAKNATDKARFIVTAP